MPPRFARPIAVRRTGQYDDAGRALWQLRQPLLFYSEQLATWLMVPVGFVTNYASVPRAPVVYWYCGDRVYEEPALHDFAYTAHAVYRAEVDESTGALRGEPVLQPLDKDQADALFLEALLANPTIPAGMAHTMHKAVSWFGRGSWEAVTSVAQPPELLAALQIQQAQLQPA